MKKHSPILPFAFIAFFLTTGCSEKESAFEADLPVVESFVVEKITDDSSFTHLVEYTFVYPDGLESYTSFPPILWNDGGPPEGESFLLSRLNPKGKAKENSHQEGRKLHTTIQYDLSGLLSSEYKNYIEIRAAGINGSIKSVSIPIEN